MKVHPGADRGNSFLESISVRRHALHVQSGKHKLFSRVEPRIPSSLYGRRRFLFYSRGQRAKWLLAAGYLIDLLSFILYHVITDNSMATITTERRPPDESRQACKYYNDTS